MMIEYSQKKYSHDFQKAYKYSQSSKFGTRCQLAVFTKPTQVQVYNELKYLPFTFIRFFHQNTNEIKIELVKHP